MHLPGRWVALAIAALALIAPATAWCGDTPVLQIAVTSDAETSAVFAGADQVVIRGGFTEVGVPRGDAVIADGRGVREVTVGPILHAAVLEDRIAFATPGRLVLLDARGRRRTIRAPWHRAFPLLVRCGPWLCFAAERGGGRLEIGAVDRTGRLRWRRRVTSGEGVVADAAALVVVHGRRLVRYARHDGRDRGAVLLPSRPAGVALGAGRVYVLSHHRGRARVDAYRRRSARRVATASFALGESTTPSGLTIAGRYVVLQGSLRRVEGEDDFEALVLDRRLHVRRTLRPSGTLDGNGTRLVAADVAHGTIQGFDPATGHADAVRRVAMADRGAFIESGPAGTVAWGDYGSPTPVATEGLAVVNVATGAITARHLAGDDIDVPPIARAGGRTWTGVGGGLVAIDDQGHTTVAPVDFGVTALAAAGGRVYAAAGEPQHLVALDAGTGSMLPFVADTGCATCVALDLAADAGIVAVTTIDTAAAAGAFAVRAFDPADGHLVFQRALSLFPFGMALGPDAIHIVGAALDGKQTSSLEATFGRDGIPRAAALRLAPFFDEGDGTAGAANDVAVIPGLGQLVVGDLQGEGPSAGACGAVLADLSGSTLSRWRPCLPGVPLSVAAFGRRVVLGLTGGLEVYDLP